MMKDMLSEGGEGPAQSGFDAGEDGADQWDAGDEGDAFTTGARPEARAYAADDYDDTADDAYDDLFAGFDDADAGDADALSFEDAVADALEEDDADEFMRRLRRIARGAQAVGRRVGQVARVAAPILSRIPLPQAQALGRIASVAGRLLAYRRASNYGNAGPPPATIINTGFQRLLAGFMVAVAQYFRDLMIGEVIRDGQLIDQRPFGSVATVQRIGLDLSYALDRSTYGNIFSLAMETGHYLRTVLKLLDTPDIKKAFDANTKWDVVEAVVNRHLGGGADLTQRAKMAGTGRRILQFVADNDFKTSIDPILFQSVIRPMGAHAEAWIAAYRTTPEGRGFPGVTPALRSVLGTQSMAA